MEIPVLSSTRQKKPIEAPITRRFWQFGCWNNWNKELPYSRNVLKDIKKRLKNIQNIKNKPDFLIISGDNYYPDKTVDAADPTVKQKIIKEELLVEGFMNLPTELPIFMILGNHDLETNTKQNLFIETISESEKKDCKIIALQKSKLEKLKLNQIAYHFFMSKWLNLTTLLLMIDTSIYEDDTDTEKYLTCYNKFFSINNLYFKPFISIEQFRKYQLSQIKREIAKKNIKHLIIVGHHPIYCVKVKEITKDKTEKKAKDKTKDKTEKKTEEKAEEKTEEKAKDKKLGAKFNSDIVKYFTPILKVIYDMLQPNTNYYYLCSDLHLYQRGKINIKWEEPNKPNKNMLIHQYIVGTGGTSLDPPLSSLPSGKVLDKYEAKLDNCILEYQLEEDKAEHGFLECLLETEVPSFTFIPVAANISSPRVSPVSSFSKSLPSGGNKSRNKTRNKSRNKSRKKIKYNKIKQYK